MPSINDLRAKFGIRPDPDAVYAKIDIGTLKLAATWFDVITIGGLVAGFTRVQDLRLKFGPRNGQMVSALAQREPHYLRDLHETFVSSPKVDTMVRAVIQLVLNETRQEIQEKHSNSFEATVDKR